ncbi:peroxiredoxin-like family protein [Sneathiella litorea]|uniref:thioredoxin-dependent peroxiredoxin n=1 Tax=Sneathiella litorea TaxID=2606216 RepID=A0A6L8W7R0_9PROT|nr:peroxiredoxin-like family protein [Sneathiella litorea]MZR30420.1 redoxin domain-containing protein [Sneathiella litorea]
MTSLRNQTDAQMDKTRQNNPEFAREVDKLLAEAKAFNQGQSALEVGDKAPDFTLPNAKGEQVSLAALLSKGAAIISFYRGSWCPYCNLQLRALSDKLTEIHHLGAELVAISPQLPDESMSIVEKHALSFPVLSDQDAKTAGSFGVSWKVPDVLAKHMKDDRGLDLEKINNGNGSILPIPATFIVDKEGRIIWRFVDVDYRNRSEPEDIIRQLKILKSNE